jgi:hypothetical protein
MAASSLAMQRTVCASGALKPLDFDPTTAAVTE